MGNSIPKEERSNIPSTNRNKGPSFSNSNASTPTNQGTNGASPSSMATSNQQYEDDSNSNGILIPTVFKWEHGGKQVYITGSFNNWQTKIPMHKSGNDFIYIHNLKQDKYYYKFLIDNEWKYAQEQAVVKNSNGESLNCIDLNSFVPYTGDENFFFKSKERKILDEEFKQIVPDVDDYTKEPPSLPPHLRHIILNKPTPTIDPQSLPSPQYVSLNHLYCTAIKDGMMVLGATQRYKDKFYTVVFYSVMPQTNTPAANAAAANANAVATSNGSTNGSTNGSVNGNAPTNGPVTPATASVAATS